MARKKRNRSASDIGAVSVPEGSESIVELNEGEDMEEQELCACGNLAEACECKHKCEFECNDEECVHQAVESAVEEPEPVVEEPEPVVEEPEPVVEEPEPVVEVVEHVEEQPVAEPEAPVAVVEPVVVPAVSEPAPVVSVAAPQAAEAPVAGPSQTASKFASILGEKSSAVSRYLGGRGTRY